MVIIILFLSTLTIKAQQVPLYSQYMLNGYLLNPSLAGSEGYSIIGLTGREQWLGFENPPRTYSLSYQTRLMQKNSTIVRTKDGKTKYKKGQSGRVGLGGYIFNDRNGLVDRTGGQFTYAYHIYMGVSQLSFGVSGSIYQFKIDKSEVTFRNPDDPLAASVDRILYVPDANCGAFYNHPKYYIGLSITQLFESIAKFSFSSSSIYDDYQVQRHYFLTAGLRHELKNESYVFEPSVLIKASEGLSLQADINAKLIYEDNFWGGISIRTNKSVVPMLGIKTGKLYIGYAFEYGLDAISSRHSYGSHEIMVSAKLGDSARRYRWIKRY